MSTWNDVAFRWWMGQLKSAEMRKRGYQLAMRIVQWAHAMLNNYGLDLDQRAAETNNEQLSDVIVLNTCWIHGETGQQQPFSPQWL